MGSYVFAAHLITLSRRAIFRYRPPATRLATRDITSTSRAGAMILRSLPCILLHSKTRSTMKPFAEPQSTPNFLGDWLGALVAGDTGVASTMRLVSRHWKDFVGQNTSELRLDLSETQSGPCSLAVALQRCGSAFPATKSLFLGPPPMPSSAWQPGHLQALNFPHLQHLDASQWTALTQEELQSLCQGCPRLQSVTLRLQDATLGEAVRALAPLKHLQHLDICAHPAGEEDLCLLQGLTSLALGRSFASGSSKGDPEEDWDGGYGGCALPAKGLAFHTAAAAAAKAPPISDAALLAVAKLPRLQVLDLHIGRASHIGIEALGCLGGLQKLTVRMDRLSPVASTALEATTRRLAVLEDVEVLVGDAACPWKGQTGGCK